MPVKNEVCDSRTWLDHQVGYCNSRQLHKTIVSDKGRAVFNGLINVAQHALKTDGQMTNNNLLLGRLAEVDTKPQLEIYADDVKCSHGATVGRIDDEQLFYLRSRGIEQQAAQQMILYAFAAELTEAIRSDALREQVLARIGQRLPGGKHDIFSRTGSRRFSGSEPGGQRSAAGLSRQRRQRAEAGGGDRRRSGILSPRLCGGASRYPYPQRGSHRADGSVRQQAATFLNARSAEELVFVRGTTEGINLVANSWGNANVGAGDNIIISEMEHHANIVPWQMLCARGASCG
jgi:hypothetical protein